MRSGSNRSLGGHAAKLLVLAVVALNALALMPASASSVTSVGGIGAFYVVSFDHSITDRDRSALARTGATIIDYEPRDSYLVWASE